MCVRLTQAARRPDPGNSVHSTERLTIHPARAKTDPMSTDTQLDTTFAALADPTRRAIVTRLLAGDCSVSDLAQPFDMTLAAVSKHLAILTRAGLVTQTRDGRTKICRLDTNSLRPAVTWMESFGSFASDDLDRLEDLLTAEGLLDPPHVT